MQKILALKCLPNYSLQLYYNFIVKILQLAWFYCQFKEISTCIYKILNILYFVIVYSILTYTIIVKKLSYKIILVIKDCSDIYEQN